MLDKKINSVVIGTSPISILIAIKLIKFGKDVLIIEKNDHFGGAWKSFKIKDGIISEASCHLIEHYRNAYRIIEELSGIKFKYCSPQPLKLYNNGKRELYTDQRQIFREFYDQLTALFKIPASIVIQCINRVLPPKMRISKGAGINKSVAINIWNRFVFFISYRVPAFMTFKGIMEPSCGYTHFAENLIINAKKEGVHFLQDEVLAVSLGKGTNVLNLKSGRKVECEKLYVPESFNLANSNELVELFGPLSKIKLTPYWHILITLHNASHPETLSSYIHLPDNTLFHRITLDKNHNSMEGQQLLIQARFDPQLKSDLNELISNLLLQANICTSLPDFTLRQVFSECLIASKRDSMFASGGIQKHDTIEVFPSIGDMARNIAINPFFKKNSV